ncbi:MAG: hypothetical protein HC927_06480 [Deltaproteobacteria bacterium]|nr:hypothetical protein [Deltaproteobacteria bacterium]
MASRRPHSSYSDSPMYEQFLLFPERAEFLGDDRFHSYRVSLEHWKALASTFREAFETVYVRGSARVLLVHGGQGHGKSLFVQTLEKDFKASARAIDVDPDNLWHSLAGGSPPSIETIRRATDTTALKRVSPRTGWLADERIFAEKDTHAVRIFLFDDAHKDPFVREWAELSQGEYARLKAENHRNIALESVAERIVEDCRGDFRRAIFVLLSNDPNYLDDLEAQLARSHDGLALRVELPLPAPALKEEIVRTNTNLLNPRSYWFCLDQGGPEEKRDAYSTLKGDRGFLDSFHAISRALAAQHRAKRAGRPANKNLLTLVTLGTSPEEVAAFLEDHEMAPDESSPGTHVGVWMFRNRWASSLNLEPGGDHSRRASLVESEFSLRWVALDMTATWLVCEAPDDDQLAAKIVDTLRSAPRIGDSKATKSRHKDGVDQVNGDLSLLAADPRVIAFQNTFVSRGQQRSQIYEPPISRRLGRPLSTGLRVRSALKPDIILEEYEPCAVTSAETPEGIDQAIRRGCHVIELTAHLQADMRGLDGYLGDKVRVYAELLESV